MRLLKILFILCAVLVASCKKDTYEVMDLSNTGVYYITNNDAVSEEGSAFTLYYELDSFLVWNSNITVEPEYKLVEVLDFSYANNRIFDFEVTRTVDDVTSNVRYSVDARDDGSGVAKGTMRIVREGEPSVTINVTVSDEERLTDQF